MSNDEEERALMRIRAAMNIFDAEEIHEQPRYPAMNPSPEAGYTPGWMEVAHIVSCHSEHFESKMHETLNGFNERGYDIAGVHYAVKKKVYTAFVWARRRP